MPKAPLKILQVAPEVTPFSKVGGLADVVGALTKEMSRAGHDVRVITPLYGFLEPKEDWTAEPGAFSVHLGGYKEEFTRLWKTTYPGSDAQVYFIEYGKYYDRHEIYTGPWGGHSDNHERFAFLSRAAIDYCHSRQWYPDVIHCHDWTVGFVPVYLNTTEYNTPLGRAATVFTIHNLMHQGIFGREVLQFAGLPPEVFRPDNLESMGLVNMMKGGIYNSTKITTVSPNYAAEIQGPEYGCGLNHVLKYRAGDLIGIINGIDTDEWNPATDKHLPANFSADDLSGKAKCKRKLQERMGLEHDSKVPIFCAIARLFDQKGLDLLAEIVPWIMSEMNVQITLLGAGDGGLEQSFLALQERFHGKVGVYIGYNNQLAHLMEAGSDFFVMPSRFEPCGLNQMYSMAYGTLPIVRSTGGLVDSVQQYVEGRERGTGFRFDEASAKALYYAIGWACSTWYDRPDDYRMLQQNAMRTDLSWTQSADKYLDVYHWAQDARLRGMGILDRTPHP
ncbi:glycogen synthase GlgA [Ruficoccus sp. ZRK36]|uniref:glycogen synthase GlgA n=1 Tax=Ruficoccus sp. ZRK36 TaxID=2866311 RepID=UPI001C73A2BB|nr:glycogen synthase GlgA [Ruficoccus sp. ZRK36]QYY36012.1 glycogen synthase GlgA [Ruficoccus sp. ZRK36]